MTKGRLEAFSNRLMTIIGFIPDKRIEQKLEHTKDVEA